MSKTKGNVVDPLEMIEEIGADALRVALVSGNAPGVDQRLTESKLTAGRNFTNKLWNAARFVLGARPDTGTAPTEPTLAARWIRSRLARATEAATRQLDGLDLAGYTATVYEVAWSDYCDWYLEMAKVELRREGATDAERAATWRAAAESLATLLRLLHPLLPFVTEEIWGALRDADASLTEGDELLIRGRWPAAGQPDADAEATFEALAALVRGARNLRTETGAAAGAWIPLVVEPSSDEAAAAVRRFEPYLTALARVRPVHVAAGGGRPELVATSPLGAAWLGVDPSANDEARTRREAQVAELDRNIERVRALLGNGSFVERAPAAVVAKERARLADLEEQRRQLAADG
jgi:valyl-tRNA synthetase